MSEKIYSYKDFKSVKSKDYWNVGCFDENMYAISHYQFGSSAGNGYAEIFKISKKEFDGFPQNLPEIKEKFGNWFVAMRLMLCSDYTDSVATFTQEKYYSI